MGGCLWLMRGGPSFSLCHVQLLLSIFWIGAFGCSGLIGLSRPVHRPIGALAGVILWTRNLPEAFIEGQIVSDGVLPPSSCPAVIGERVTNPGVDVVQAQLPLRCSCYCHGDESGIAVGGFSLGVRRGGIRHSG